MAVIAIDFDGTLVRGETLLPGARDAINLFREYGHKIIIHSCNNVAWIKKVLDNNDVRYDYVWGELEESGKKPNADLFIDDKGYRFEGWDGNELETMLTIVNGLDNRKW